MNTAITDQSGSVDIEPEKLYTQNEVDDLHKNWNEDHHQKKEIAKETRAEDKEKRQNKRKVARLVKSSNRILASVSSHALPFDLFPDVVNIEEKRITIINRHLFSSEVHSIDIKNISNILINNSILFSQLVIISDTYEENEMKVKNLENKPLLVKLIRLFSPMDSASAIICWKNKILLFLRDDRPDIPHPNCWQIPGGGIEEGENPNEGIRRELLEEVSHVPDNLKLLQRIKKPDGKIAYIYHAFVNDNEAGKFKMGKTEGQDVAFFTLDEIESLKLTPILRRNLEIHKDKLEKVLKNKSFEDFTF